MGKQNAYSWMAEQGSATHLNRQKWYGAMDQLSGATDRVMDGATEGLTDEAMDEVTDGPL